MLKRFSQFWYILQFTRAYREAAIGRDAKQKCFEFSFRNFFTPNENAFTLS